MTFRQADLEQPVDVVMCVGAADVGRLFGRSLVSCLKNFLPLGRLIVVTNAHDHVRATLLMLGLGGESRIEVVRDEEALSWEWMELPGWCRQQAIRLTSDSLSRGPFVACLSADTILLEPIDCDDLIAQGQAILYYNRYPFPCGHLDYERRRVANVAKLLGVAPLVSEAYGDFIMDLRLFSTVRLRQLRHYLASLYGASPYRYVIPKRCETEDERASFGEWTLYAVYELDVLNLQCPVRNSENRFVAQVHSERELQLFDFNAKAVHFVSKNFDLDLIGSLLDRHSASKS